MLIICLMRRTCTIKQCIRMCMPFQRTGAWSTKGDYYPALIYKPISNQRCSEALPYLPTRTEPLKVTLGIDEKKTTSIPTGESLKLGKSTLCLIRWNRIVTVVDCARRAL